MKTRFLLALLTATALIPTAAMAQDEPDVRVPRGRERIERQGGEAPGARGEFRGGFDGGVRVQAPAPRPDVQRSEGPRGDDGARWQGCPDRGERPDAGGWGNRPDRGWDAGPGRPDIQRRDPPRDAQGQIDREQLRRQWQGDRGDAWQRDRQRDEWQRDQQRRDWQRDQQRREWDRDQQRREWDRNPNDWSRSGGDWRDNDRYRNDWNDRRQWNRAWRNDTRYDWNRYRDSNRGIYRLPRYYAPQGWGYGYRRFGIGVTLNSFLFGSNYWINDPYYYRLPEAYGPYRWVRYYNDALLVDVRTGRVVDVEYDIFW